MTQADGSQDPPVPLSPARVWQGLIFVSGQVGVDPATGEVPDDREHEMRVAFDNLGSVLREAGGSFQTVLKTTVYITTQDDFQLMNGVYGDYFSAPFPVRTTLVTQLAAPRYRFEIDAVAHAQTPADDSA